MKNKINYIILISIIIIPVHVESANSNSWEEKFIGVNLRGYSTSISEVRDPSFELPDDYYEKSFQILNSSSMNSIRYVFAWESFIRDPENFLKELDLVATSADRYDINVIYANDQYHLSSWLDNINGLGFPSFLFQGSDNYKFGSGGSGDEQVAQEWWTNWYNRTVHHYNGTDGWALQANFLKMIVNLVDNHTSTFGYEILNEPIIYSEDQWEKVGKYNSFITDQLREITNKTIVFDRQLPSDLGGTIQATPENMAKMAPQNKENTLFKTTLYGLPNACSYAEARLHSSVQTGKILGIPVWMGEFNIGINVKQPQADITQGQMDLFHLKFLESNLFGWNLWLWSLSKHPPEVKNYDLSKINSTGVYHTKYLTFFNNTIKKFEGFNLSKEMDTICPTIIVNKINDTPLSNSSHFEGKLKGPVEIQGQVFDSNGKVKEISYRINGDIYKNMTLTDSGEWNIKDNFSNGTNRLIIKAVDDNNNTEYHTLNMNLSQVLK